MRDLQLHVLRDCIQLSSEQQGRLELVSRSQIKPLSRFRPTGLRKRIWLRETRLELLVVCREEAYDYRRRQVGECADTW